MSDWPNFDAVPYEIAAALGIIPNVTAVFGFGNNPDVDIASLPESAWTQGGMYPWMPNPPPALQIHSASAQDAVGGTGVSAVTIRGLSSDLLYMEEIVVLQGITFVPLIKAFYRLNTGSASALGSGNTTGVNAGIIHIEDVAAPNTIRMMIPAGKGNSQQAAYTVEKGHTFVLTDLLLDVLSPTGLSNQYAQMAPWIRPLDGVVNIPLQLGNTSGQPILFPGSPPFNLQEGTDFDLILLNVSDNNENVTAAWNGYLIHT